MKYKRGKNPNSHKNGFTKGNKLWDNPNAKKNWFKKGEHPSPKTELKKGHSKTAQLFNLSKLELEELYLKQNLSSNKIAEKINLSGHCVRVWLKKYNIPIKNFKISKEKENKICELYLKEYSGYEISKLLKVGLARVFKILRKNNIIIRNVYRSKRTIKKIKKNRAKQVLPKRDTKIEVKIQNFLKTLGIEFFTHQYMDIKHNYLCDILIPSMNLVIECDGTYWHKYPIGNDLDYIRTKELIEKGFKVLRLWEFEINEMSVEGFENKLGSLR